MKKSVVFLCLLGWLFVGITPVFAVPVSFDLTTVSTNFSYLEDGVTLSAITSYEGGSDALITRTTSGLGVDSFAVNDSSGTLDGSGVLDMLSFVFAKPVVLLEVVFSWVNDHDEFSLLVDDVVAIEDTFVLGNFDFSPYQFTGEVFSFAATDSSDSYRIRSLTVDAPVPTPEPSTWILLASGILGFVGWRKYFQSSFRSVD